MSTSVSTAPCSVSNLSIKQLQRRLEKASDHILNLNEENFRLKHKLSREVSDSRSKSSQLLQYEIENGELRCKLFDQTASTTRSPDRHPLSISSIQMLHSQEFSPQRRFTKKDEQQQTSFLSNESEQDEINRLQARLQQKEKSFKRKIYIERQTAAYERNKSLEFQ